MLAVKDYHGEHRLLVWKDNWSSFLKTDLGGFSMRRNVGIPTLLYALIIFLISLHASAKSESVQGKNISLAPLPETSFACMISMTNDQSNGVAYIVHNFQREGVVLTVTVTQYSLDQDAILYEDDTYNETEDDLRAKNSFSDEENIVGSYCEMFIISEDNGERLSYYRSHCSKPSNFFDETFYFSLDEFSEMPTSISLDITYGVVDKAGAIDENALGYITISVPIPGSSDCCRYEGDDDPELV